MIISAPHRLCSNVFTSGLTGEFRRLVSDKISDLRAIIFGVLLGQRFTSVVTLACIQQASQLVTPLQHFGQIIERIITVDLHEDCQACGIQIMDGVCIK